MIIIVTKCIPVILNNLQQQSKFIIIIIIIIKVLHTAHDLTEITMWSDHVRSGDIVNLSLRQNQCLWKEIHKTWELTNKF